MKKQRTTSRSVRLVSAGIVAGTLAFSNVELTLPGQNAPFAISGSAGDAVAAENIQGRPSQALFDLNESFVRIAESATPSVVTIYTETTVDRPTITPFDFFGNPFSDLFRLPKPGAGKSNGRQEVHHGLGSGVITSADGYILTNNHVISRADTIWVRLSDNRKLPAEVVGTDPRSDIAVIKVKAGGLKPIAFGDSDRLRVAEWVIAIGSPLRENLAHTVTQGIVSAKGRANVGLADYEDFIQTDAAINLGNSGGALVNINGELIGINTAIASHAGGFEGIGFAIPSNMARKVFTALVKSGKVARGYLGVSLQNIDENIARGLKMNAPEGVLVSGVIEGSPAEKAGLKSGDVILEFNGRKVSEAVELRKSIADLSPGSIAEVRINRDGAPLALKAHLEELSVQTASVTTGQVPEVSNKVLGFAAAPLDAQTAERFNKKPRSSRVIVTAVKESSRAYQAGIRPGDIILSVDKKPITSYAMFNDLVKDKKSGELLFVLIERGWSRIYFAFNL
jgi:serine protease Do